MKSPEQHREAASLAQASSSPPSMGFQPGARNLKSDSPTKPQSQPTSPPASSPISDVSLLMRDGNWDIPADTFDILDDRLDGYPPATRTTCERSTAAEVEPSQQSCEASPPPPSIGSEADIRNLECDLLRKLQPPPTSPPASSPISNVSSCMQSDYQEIPGQTLNDVFDDPLPSEQTVRSKSRRIDTPATPETPSRMPSSGIPTRTPRLMIRSLNIRSRPENITSIDLTPTKAAVRSRKTTARSSPSIPSSNSESSDGSTAKSAVDAFGINRPNLGRSIKRVPNRGGEKASLKAKSRNRPQSVAVAATDVSMSGSKEATEEARAAEAAHLLFGHLKKLTKICGKAYCPTESGLPTQIKGKSLSVSHPSFPSLCVHALKSHAIKLRIKISKRCLQGSSRCSNFKIARRLTT